MKWLYTSLLLPLLFMVACQVPSNIDVGSVIDRTAAAVDRNHDGQVTKDEIRGAKDDPMTWISIGSALLALLGLSSGVQAQRKAKQVEAETDDLYDRVNGAKQP